MESRPPPPFNMKVLDVRSLAVALLIVPALATVRTLNVSLTADTVAGHYALGKAIGAHMASDLRNVLSGDPELHRV